jgi:hypothetical protein
VIALAEGTSQFALKRVVEHGMKEIVQTAAGGGLLGLHGADVGHAGGELFLQWQRRNGQVNLFDGSLIDFERPVCRSRARSNLAASCRLFPSRL